MRQHMCVRVCVCCAVFVVRVVRAHAHSTNVLSTQKRQRPHEHQPAAHPPPKRTHVYNIMYNTGTQPTRCLTILGVIYCLLCANMLQTGGVVVGTGSKACSFAGKRCGCCVQCVCVCVVCVSQRPPQCSCVCVGGPIARRHV